jgi:glucosamine-6-phosphate deaminase
LVSFSQSYLVELDDYYGIPLEDRRNLYAWLDKVFIHKVDFQPSHITRFNTQAPNPIIESNRVQNTLTRRGGIGLAVLGLGPNGHLGFNEPGSDFTSPTRVIDLTPASVESNARYWGKAQDVPRQGFTLGLGVLCRADWVILLVNGEKKASILQKTIRGPITQDIPGTCLQQIKNVSIICDSQAAKFLA